MSLKPAYHADQPLKSRTHLLTVAHTHIYDFGRASTHTERRDARVRPDEVPEGHPPIWTV